MSDDGEMEYDPEMERLFEFFWAVKDWQEVRKRILTYPFKSTPDEEQLALWAELARWESILMSLK